MDRYVLGNRYSAYPVEGFDGRIGGLITLAQLRAVPPSERPAKPVRDFAIPLAAVPTTTPDQPLAELLEHLTRDTGGRALVFDAGRLVGIVTLTDVARTLEIRTLDAEQRPR